MSYAVRDAAPTQPRTRIESYGVWTRGQRVLAHSFDADRTEWCTITCIPRRPDGTVYVTFDGGESYEVDCFQLYCNANAADRGEDWAQPANRRVLHDSRV